MLVIRNCQCRIEGRPSWKITRNTKGFHPFAQHTDALTQPMPAEHPLCTGSSSRHRLRSLPLRAASDGAGAHRMDSTQVAQRWRTCQGGRHKRCGLDPWFREIPWRRECNPILQLLYFCLENVIDRGAWRAIAQEIAESLTRQRTHTHTHTKYRQWRPRMKSKARKRWTSQIGRKTYSVRGCQGSPHWEKVTLGWNPKEKGVTSSDSWEEAHSQLRELQT